jgi:hypothetical protein
MAGSKMQGSCRCQVWQATTRHLAVKKIPRPLNYLILKKNAPFYKCNLTSLSRKDGVDKKIVYTTENKNGVHRTPQIMVFFGGADRDRTDDLMTASPLSPIPLSI